MTKRTFIAISLLVGVLMIAGVATVSAQQKLNVEIPDIGGSGGIDSTSGGFAQYIRAVYSYSLVIASFLALFVMVYGSIKYILSRSNPSNMEDAKAWIMGGIYGLLLLLGAFVLLYTINPELVQLKELPQGPNVQFGGYNSDAERQQAFNESQNLRNQIRAVLDRIYPPNTYEPFEDKALRFKAWAESQNPLLNNIFRVEQLIAQDEVRNKITVNKKSARDEMRAITQNAVREGRALDFRYSDAQQKWNTVNSSIGSGTQLELDRELYDQIKIMREILPELENLEVAAASFQSKVYSPIGEYAVALLDAGASGIQKDIDAEELETACRGEWTSAYITTVRARIPNDRLISHIQSGRTAVAGTAYYMWVKKEFDNIDWFDSASVTFPSDASLRGGAYDERIYTTNISSLNDRELYLQNGDELFQIMDAFEASTNITASKCDIFN
jgi:hypothetical protein